MLPRVAYTAANDPFKAYVLYHDVSLDPELRERVALIYS